MASLRRPGRRLLAAAVPVACLTLALNILPSAQAAPKKPAPAPVTAAAPHDPLTMLPAPPKPPTAQPTQPVATASGVKSTAARVDSGALAATAPGVQASIGSGTPRTLVLYDTSGDYGWMGEFYAIAAGQLASHFGGVAFEPVSTYVSGQAATYAQVIYLGSSYNEPLPASFVADVTTGTTPVIWAGFNVWQLAATATGTTDFISRYGWDASTSYIDATDAVPWVQYKGQTLTRDATDNLGGILAPHIVTPSQVTVLANGVCGGASAPSTCASIAQTTGSTLPWAIRSANLTYVGEIPFSYMSETDRYLAFADLLYAGLAPNTAPVRMAAVRLEDVSPMSDPTQLRAVADYLYSQNVPFQVAVIPEYTDPLGALNGGAPQTFTLAQKPKLVSALRYMQSKGGVLIQHGTTHQSGTLNNPYDAVSGDDFEFFAAGCSTTPSAPFTWTACTSSNYVQLTGALPGDSQSADAARITTGRSLFTAAGLGTPTVFEFPHYAATPSAYAAAASVYSTRYERALYFSGALSGTPGTTRWFGQFFPYSVTDIYGSRVLPEDLGNYEAEAYSGHPAVLPPDIIARAQADLVVTESTASFFFHPYYPLAQLQQIVTGIKALGYTFVPASGLP